MTSLIETQKNLEELYHKNQLMDVLRNEFSPLTNDPFKLDVICQIYLHKQADVPTMVGLFSPKWGEPDEIGQLLIECVEENLLDFDLNTYKFIFKYTLTDDVEEMLARYQFPLPMIVRPKKVKHNFMGSGYYDNKGCIILNGSKIYKDEDVCLDHINRSNAVKLSLNLDVIESPEGELIEPERKIGESFIDYQRRKKQAKTFFENSVHVMEQIASLGNEFYLTHKYDRRGRVYCVGYHINEQGTDYNKAVLELANKEVVK